MIKKLILFYLCFSSPLYAADLLSVYHDAANDSPILGNNLNTALANSQVLGVNFGAMLPQVTVSGTANENNIQSAGTSNNYSNAAYTLTATQVIFNYNTFANVSVGAYDKDAAMSNYEAQKQQFIFNVAQAYFNVLTAEYDLNLALAQYQFLKKTMTMVQAKFSAGLVPYTDVAQARANLDSARATLVQSQNALQIANENLATFTGKIETHLAQVTSDFPVLAPQPHNIKVWTQWAETRNPLLLAQRYTQSAALASVHAAVGNELPNVFVEASYEKNYYSENVPSFVSTLPNTLNKTLELGLSWTVFQGGELMSQTLQTANQYVSQEDTTLNLYRQTWSQTTQDYLNVMASMSQVKAYEQSQVSAEVTLKEFNAKYKVGAATIVDVLNAVQSLYEARYNLASSMNQYIDNMLALKQDVGTLSEKDLMQLNQHLKVQEIEASDANNFVE